MNKLRITWKKSAIGYKQNQRRVIQALGLRSLNDVVIRDDSPQIRGMINKVQHLLKVEEATGEG